MPTAVQIVYSSHRGSREIEHIGSAHDDAELELLKAVARQRLAAGQGELDLGLEAAAAAGCRWRAAADHRLADGLPAGCPGACLPGAGLRPGQPAAMRCSGQLVLARIIEPVSKLDSVRVLEEAGVAAASYATLKRRLPVYAKDSWRQRISAACAAHAALGPASLVLYDVSTLYFETDAGDGFRETGFSKERRLEPQITIGLLTGPVGVPADGQRVRGEQGRDQDHAAGHRVVHGRAPAAGRDGRRGRRDGVARRIRRRSRPPGCRSSSA